MQTSCLAGIVLESLENVGEGGAVGLGVGRAGGRDLALLRGWLGVHVELEAGVAETAKGR